MFLSGGSEMGERIRGYEWGLTPLGPIAGWPQSLRTAISLIFEDHAASLLALASLLKRSGYETVEAMNVAEARERAAAQEFDLVISDLGLPDGTGLQLMEELRSQYRLRGIALTGYGMEEDIARAREAGFIAHLIKPVQINELRSVLAALD